jgi:hypothetical protein
MCWKKCITGQIHSGELERGEKSCLRGCVDAFAEIRLWPSKEELRKMALG